MDHCCTRNVLQNPYDCHILVKVRSTIVEPIFVKVPGTGVLVPCTEYCRFEGQEMSGCPTPDRPNSRWQQPRIQDMDDNIPVQFSSFIIQVFRVQLYHGRIVLRLQFCKYAWWCCDHRQTIPPNGAIRATNQRSCSISAAGSGSAMPYVTGWDDRSEFLCTRRTRNCDTQDDTTKDTAIESCGLPVIRATTTTATTAAASASSNSGEGHKGT